MQRELVIAVIEDDGSFRTALVESLLSQGYDARGFASVEEFIDAGGERSSDCVITDIHMPGMNGLELGRRLTVRPSRVPVIMITARTEPGLDARAENSGAVCLLRKPFNADALTECLKKALQV